MPETYQSFYLVRDELWLERPESGVYRLEIEDEGNEWIRTVSVYDDNPIEVDLDY